MKSTCCCVGQKSSCSGCCARRKRSPLQRRVALGKTFLGSTYRPQFALGIPCAGEREQQALFARLGRELPGHDIKVLVI